ncbi:MAG: hypothetical protein RIC55_12260 [Pirellulaceae bacterium]
MQRRCTQRLREEVGAILLHDWDPLGVRHVAGAANEYDGYVETICQMLVDGADVRKLGDHLHRLESDAMGLSSPTENAQVVANRLRMLVR